MPWKKAETENKTSWTAKEISVDAGAVWVLSKFDGIFFFLQSIKTTLEAFLCGHHGFV